MTQNYQKTNNETLDQYFDRLCMYRDQGIDNLSWKDIADLMNRASGENKHYDTYRKRYLRGHSIVAKPVYTEPINELEEDPLDLVRKERYRLADERSQVNALYRRIAREDSLKDIALEVAKTIDGSFKLELPTKLVAKESDKEAILEISDWHYGLDEHSIWNDYDPDIAKERVAKLTAETIKYCKLNGISKLHVVDLGDMIAGKIHEQIRINSRFDIITQIIQVSEIIAEMLSELSKNYIINYYSTLDNHSRLDNNLKESLELESLVRITKWFLKERLKDNKNITIHDNEFGEDIVSFRIFDHNVVGVHGNKDTPTNVIKNMTLHTHRHFDLVLVAHRHHFSAEESNETLCIANGSLMGTDSFALKLRLNSFPSQNLIIVTPDNVAECIYKINLN